MPFLLRVELPDVPGSLAALLAVLKSGGAYVPVEPDEPPERLLACEPVW